MQCIVVHPLLSEVALTGRLTDLPLGKQFLSSSILCCSNHFSLLSFHCSVCSDRLHCILTPITNMDGYSCFPLSLLLKEHSKQIFLSRYFSNTIGVEPEAKELDPEHS